MRLALLFLIAYAVLHAQDTIRSQSRLVQV